jgi:hypothetical protein
MFETNVFLYGEKRRLQDKKREKSAIYISRKLEDNSEVNLSLLQKKEDFYLTNEW